MSKWETALQHPQNSHFHCQHQRTHQPYQEVSLCTDKSSRWWSRECIHYSPSRIKEEMCHEIQSVCHSFFLSQDSLQTPTAQSQDLSTGLPNNVCQRWRPSPHAAKQWDVPGSRAAQRKPRINLRLLTSSDSVMLWLVISLVKKISTVKRKEYSSQNQC